MRAAANDGRPTRGGRPPIHYLPPELRPRLAAWVGCHGNPDRCLVVGGWRSPVCARCAGMLAGYPLALGALLLLGIPGFERAAAGALLLVPAAVDGGRQMLTAYRSTSARRLSTGVLAGFGQFELLGGLTGGILRALHG
ncbi:MAG TPA: DUF2085 domain-containing protein [Gemmatimonadota bacterium]|nr:DUF2085 domain-containing protein [Gemmatimonadota bacterium]